MHFLTVEETLKRYSTVIDGLSDEEAESRLKKFGPNKIETEKKEKWYHILIRQFKGVLIYLLYFAAAISVFAGIYENDPESFIEAGVILGIVVINGILGFRQEYRAEAAMEALKKLAAPTARVRRNGKMVEIDAANVVPGDILVLEEGDRIAADGRLIKSVTLYADESLLTGESVPVRKDANVILSENTLVAERSNMVFMGTTVTRGHGEAIVVNTGLNTEMGKIAKYIAEAESEETPFQKDVNRFGKQVGVLIVVLAIVIAIFFVYVYGFEIREAIERAVIDALILSISLAVSAVPEGLPVVITVALAIGLERMAKQNAIVKKLSAVETLGRVTVICSDKTGTLTKNEMTVRKIFVDGKYYDVTGSGYEPKGEILLDGERAKIDGDLKLLIEVGVHCNNARLVFEDGIWKIYGDPTEGALVVLGEKVGIKPMLVRVDENPFDSDRKRMTTVHKYERSKIAYVKGAPDVLLELSTKALIDGKEVPLTDEVKKEYLNAVESMSKKALRVLGFAIRHLEEYKNVEDVEKELTFIGLVGMIDPPRPEVPDAVKVAKEAGIRSIMITGDHAATALAIAKEIGLTERDKVLTGKDLMNMSPEDLKKAVMECDIFARVSSENKLEILKALKANGEIVAMTGDGVNDAPALKGADIGVGMGKKGTDVAKEASHMILQDDNYATIVSAVREGRVIYDRVLAFVKFLLSANFDEIALVTLGAIVVLASPLFPLQILWENVLTDGLPAIALAMVKGDPDVMERPPRKKTSMIKPMIPSLIARFLLAFTVEAGIFLYMFFVEYGLRPGIDTNTERFMEISSTVYTTCVMFELFFAFECRSETQSLFKGKIEKELLLFTVLSMVIQAMAIFVEPLHPIFSTTYIDLEDYLLVVFGSTSIIPAEEIRKYFARKKLRRELEEWKLKRKSAQ
ncbi:MAG: cation-translocating P-type ATPase [Candidatus Korarchaeota archaeon]